MQESSNGAVLNAALGGAGVRPKQGSIVHPRPRRVGASSRMTKWFLCISIQDLPCSRFSSSGEWFSAMERRRVRGLAVVKKYSARPDDNKSVDNVATGR